MPQADAWHSVSVSYGMRNRDDQTFPLRSRGQPPMLTFDEVRARVPLSSVVMLATHLIHDGGGQWFGKCPLCVLPRSDEALTVADSAAVWTCVECQTAGNHVSFITRAWGTTHAEAFAILEAEATRHYKPLSTRSPIVRANGNTNHSMSPMLLGDLTLGDPDALRLKDASLLCAMVARPDVALANAEQIVGQNGLTTGARAAVGAILGVLGGLDAPSPENALAAVLGSSAGSHLARARSICNERLRSDAATTAESILTGGGTWR